METAKLSIKNQIVIPKQMRETLKVRAGDEILFVSRNGVVYLLAKGGSLTSELKGAAKGRLRYPRRYLKKERSSW